jgi:hypothetical protein
MKQPEACHRYQQCSVNDCPLADKKYLAEESDDEIKCPLTEYDIEKIKERYNRIKNNPVIVPEPEPIFISDRMKDENNNLYRMTAEQIRKVNALIRSECCNFESGKCKLLMDDCISKCPQISAPSVLCAWCREAIIPLAPDLEAQIFKNGVKVKSSSNHSHMKQCVNCGKRFKSITGRGKYCSRCVIKIQRKQQAEYNRKRRLKAKNSAV